eukprot:Hpha_TRINITY_DN15763_c5_g2::TRINITY_DN15763_c5_g2_i3::g.37010::m.37010
MVGAHPRLGGRWGRCGALRRHGRLVALPFCLLPLLRNRRDLRLQLFDCFQSLRVPPLVLQLLRSRRAPESLTRGLPPDLTTHLHWHARLSGHDRLRGARRQARLPRLLARVRLLEGLLRRCGLAWQRLTWLGLPEPWLARLGLAPLLLGGTGGHLRGLLLRHRLPRRGLLLRHPLRGPPLLLRQLLLRRGRWWRGRWRRGLLPSCRGRTENVIKEVSGAGGGGLLGGRLLILRLWLLLLLELLRRGRLLLLHLRRILSSRLLLVLRLLLRLLSVVAPQMSRRLRVLLRWELGGLLLRLLLLRLLLPPISLRLVISLHPQRIYPQPTPTLSLPLLLSGGQ